MSAEGFLNLDEQIDLIIDKGILIENRKNLYDLLQKYNYHTLMKYRIFFYKYNENNEIIFHKYVSNLNFEEIYYMKQLNDDLRSLIFNKIHIIKHLLISKCIRIIVPYCGGFKENNFLNVKNFNFNKESDTRKYINEIKKKFVTMPALIDYREKHKFIPLWLYLDLCTTKEIIEFIGNLNNEIKTKMFLEELQQYNLSVSDLTVLIELLMRSYKLVLNNDIVLRNPPSFRVNYVEKSLLFFLSIDKENSDHFIKAREKLLEAYSNDIRCLSKNYIKKTLWIEEKQ